MALRSVDPTTGELIEEYEETTAVAARLHPGRGLLRVRRLAPDAVRGARAEDAGGGRPAGGAAGGARPADGGGDGQAARAGPGRGRQVRLGVPRTTPTTARGFLADARRGDGRVEQLRALRAARAGAGGDAVELPVLAGLPLRGAGADGGQRGAAEARRQRDRLRARDRGRSSATRASRRRSSARCSSAPSAWRDVIGGPRGEGGDAHRQHARRPGGRAPRRAPSLKKTVLELGGSDPYVVLEDADLDAAAETCAASRLINAGQSCIAAKRFIVVERCARAFEERFVARMAARRGGRPAGGRRRRRARWRARDLRDELHAAGASERRRGRARAARRRGPGRARRVLPADACWPASAGHAGLRRGDVRAGGGRDRGQDEADGDRDRERLAVRARRRGVHARPRARRARRGASSRPGSCFVNALVRSDPRLPFGGIKESGYGRELADFGIHEFVNIKSVYIK